MLQKQGPHADRNFNYSLPGISEGHFLSSYLAGSICWTLLCWTPPFHLAVSTVKQGKHYSIRSEAIQWNQWKKKLLKFRFMLNTDPQQIISNKYFLSNNLIQLKINTRQDLFFTMSSLWSRPSGGMLWNTRTSWLPSWIISWPSGVNSHFLDVRCSASIT